MKQFLISAANKQISALSGQVLAVIDELIQQFDQEFDDPGVDIVTQLKDHVEGSNVKYQSWLNNQLPILAGQINHPLADITAALQKMFASDTANTLKVLSTTISGLTQPEQEKSPTQADKIKLPLIEKDWANQTTDGDFSVGLKLGVEASYQLEALRQSTLEPDNNTNGIDQALVGVGFDGKIVGSFNTKAPFASGSFGIGMAASKSVELDYYFKATEDEHYVTALSRATNNMPELYKPDEIAAAFNAPIALHQLIYQTKGELKIDASVAIGKVISAKAIKATAGLSLQATSTISGDFIIKVGQHQDGRLLVTVSNKKVNTSSDKITLGITIDASDLATKYHQMVAEAMPEFADIKAALGDYLDLGTRLKTELDTLLGVKITATMGSDLATSTINKIQTTINNHANVLSDKVTAVIDEKVIDILDQLPIDTQEKTAIAERLKSALTKEQGLAVKDLTASISDNASFKKLENAINNAGKTLEEAAERIDQLTAPLKAVLDKYQVVRSKILGKLEQASKENAELNFYRESKRVRGDLQLIKVALDLSNPQATQAYRELLTGDIASLFSQQTVGIEVISGLLSSWGNSTIKSGFGFSFIGLTAGSESLLNSDAKIEIDNHGNIVAATKGSVTRSSYFNSERREASFFDALGLAAQGTSGNVPLGIALSYSGEKLDSKDITDFFQEAADKQIVSSSVLTDLSALLNKWGNNSNKKLFNAKIELQFKLSEDEYKLLIQTQNSTLDKAKIRRAVIEEYIHQGYLKLPRELEQINELLGGFKSQANTETELAIDRLVKASDMTLYRNQWVEYKRNFHSTGIQLINNGGSLNRKKYRSVSDKLRKVARHAYGLSLIIEQLGALGGYIKQINPQTNTHTGVDELLLRQNKINENVQGWMDVPTLVQALFGVDLRRQPLVMIGSISRLVEREGPIVIPSIRQNEDDDKSRILLG